MACAADSDHFRRYLNLHSEVDDMQPDLSEIDIN